jgi:hypothetical protein
MISGDNFTTVKKTVRENGRQERDGREEWAGKGKRERKGTVVKQREKERVCGKGKGKWKTENGVAERKVSVDCPMLFLFLSKLPKQAILVLIETN